MSSEISTFTMPEGRGINLHLFVRQVYKDPVTGQEGTPRYSVEMAYPKPAEGETDQLDLLEAYCVEVLNDQFGAQKVNEYMEAGYVNIPIKDGDKKAARREANGKPGDAYKNMWVISASTGFNKNGDADAGGIDVFDAQVEPIEAVNKSKVHNGCMGVVAVKGKGYSGTSRESGDPFMSVVLYLEAFQMTGEGERLASAPNRSGLFQKRPQSGGQATGTRAARS